MRGVVFKNLGQKFSSITRTADLDSNSLFAVCAASSPPPPQWEFRQAGTQNLELPPAGTRGAVHPGRAQYYSGDPLRVSESCCWNRTKDTLRKLETPPMETSN